MQLQQPTSASLLLTKRFADSIEENSNDRIYLQRRLILNSPSLFLSENVNGTKKLLSPGSNNNQPSCLSKLSITQQEEGYKKVVP